MRIVAPFERKYTSKLQDIECIQNPNGSWFWRVFDTATNETVCDGNGFSSLHEANAEAEKHLKLGQSDKAKEEL
jgi:hypothetical protein